MPGQGSNDPNRIRLRDPSRAAVVAVAATPEPSRAADPVGGLERLQVWAGADCEAEWFAVPESGVSLSRNGIEVRASRSRCSAASVGEEMRLRLVFRVIGAEQCASIEANGIGGGFVVLRDAMGLELLQLVAGVSKLALAVAEGRYAVDAQLPANASLFVELRPAARTITIRAV